MKTRSLIALALLLALVSFTAGCKKKEKVVSVSGVATYKGEPLVDCSVFFTPVAPVDPQVCVSSVGKTDSEGKFTLMTTELDARPGAVVGKHKVAFRFMAWGTELADGEESVAPPVLPQGYTDGSKIEFDVPEKGTDSANFDLE